MQFSDKKGVVFGKKGAKLGIGQKCHSLFRGYETIAVSRPGAFKGSQSSGLPASGVVLGMVLRLGMVTTCPPKVRDGHHMSA